VSVAATRNPCRFSVALLIETSNAYSRELLHGIRDWIRTHSNWTIHLTEQGRGATPPPWLHNWRGDGIIARIENREIQRAVRASGLPAVNVSASGLGPEIPCVVSQSAGVARLAAEHLLERGFKNFGFCGDARFAWSSEHQRNFSAELERAGQRCSVFASLAADFTDWERERRKLAHWIEKLPKPVGVMACYDIRGQQLLDVCRELRLHVPDEVAVIGQHNDELLCELCDPPLSSVIPHPRRAGVEAAALLDQLLRRRRPRTFRIEIPPLGVATRQSTDVVAVGDRRLAKSMCFIRDHAYEEMSVVDIVRAAGMSRSLFERKFRDAFGTSPWEHVLNLRLRRARLLLQDSHLSIAEIAERTGFSTPEYFTSLFRQVIGRTPGAERVRLRGDIRSARGG
jgi:LacI family transcriptional regulator